MYFAGFYAGVAAAAAARTLLLAKLYTVPLIVTASGLLTKVKVNVAGVVPVIVALNGGVPDSGKLVICDFSISSNKLKLKMVVATLFTSVTTDK